MNRYIVSALAAVLACGSANAAVVADFELPVASGGPANGTYTNVTSIQGWTAFAGDLIELQNNVAGAPSTGAGIFNGGNVFVELDSTHNSAMYYTFATAGLYTLDFIYSARPGIASGSNGIEVTLAGGSEALLGFFTAAGGGQTAWTQQSRGPFSVLAGDTLVFRAAGTSDSFGGYVDNITLTAVPEPTTWAMLFTGFLAIGSAMRRRRRDAVSFA